MSAAHSRTGEARGTYPRGCTGQGGAAGWLVPRRGAAPTVAAPRLADEAGKRPRQYVCQVLSYFKDSLKINIALV